MSRLLLLLGHQGNRRVLEQALGSRHELWSPAPGDQLEADCPFDLAIVDGAGLARHVLLVERWRAAALPAFLPVVLLATRADAAPAAHVLGPLVDDLLVMPLVPVELHARLANLLRLRTLSLEMEGHVAARTAELQSALHDLDAFSTMVAHDLRAPVRAVTGLTTILLEEHAARLEPQGQHYLHIVHDSGVRMGHLIGGLLAFARLGRGTVSRQQIDLGALAQDVVAALASQREHRCIEIHVGQLGFVQGDALLLTQVLINLLDNAIKFTQQRQIAHIQIDHVVQDGEHVYLVRDDGTGFDMGRADRLFELFQRLHSATDYEGTGAGLAIVKRIIERHGGRVWATSAPGQGTTICFTLPSAA